MPLFKCLLIYFERARVHRRKAERGRIPSRHHTVGAEPDPGLNLINREITG